MEIYSEKKTKRKKHKKKDVMMFGSSSTQFGNPKKCKFGNLGTQELGHDPKSFLGTLSLVEIFRPVSPGKILKKICDVIVMTEKGK